MRRAGLVNPGVVLALLLGPGIGAIAHWALAALAHGGRVSLAATVVPNATIGYLLALPVFLPVILVLRHFRADSVLACTAAGFAIGVLAYFTMLEVVGSGWAPLVFQAGLPFGLMFLAARLIAGRRK